MNEPLDGIGGDLLWLLLLRRHAGIRDGAGKHQGAEFLCVGCGRELKEIRLGGDDRSLKIE